MEHARRLNLTSQGIARDVGQEAADWIESGEGEGSSSSSNGGAMPPPPLVEAQLRSWLETTSGLLPAAPPFVPPPPLGPHLLMEEARQALEASQEQEIGAGLPGHVLPTPNDYASNDYASSDYASSDYASSMPPSSLPPSTS